MVFFANGNNRFALHLLSHSSFEVRKLTLAMILREFAGSAIMLFEPIFLYTRGYSVAQILLFYAAVYAAYAVIAPLGGKFVRAHGYEHGIMYSTPFLVAYYLSLYGVSFTPWAFIPAALCIAFSKTLFWVGFHADFARFGSVKGSQGKEISTFVVLAGVAAILGPMVGGAVLSLFGFTPLFFGVATILLISNIPLLVTAEKFEPRTLSYGDAWRRLVRPDHRAQLLTFFGHGNELVTQTIWPLYMFLIVPGFAVLGFIGTVSSVMALMASKIIGRFTDARGRHRTLSVGVVYHAAMWIARIFAWTPGSVLVTHALARMSHDSIGIPLTALTYEYARGYSVTKTALFLEMSVAIGKLLTALAAAALFYFLPGAWGIAFAGAAALTLLYFFARRAFHNHVT